MLFLPWLHLEPNAVQALVSLMPGQGFQLIAGSCPVTSEHRQQVIPLPWDQSTSAPQPKVLNTGSTAHSPAYSIKMLHELG